MKAKETIITIGLWILVVIGILIALSIIALEVYVWITYGGKPIGEIPSWALWFMFKGGE
jgi:hypothetical protein